MGYIYKITNLIDGKIYIGQTIRTIEQRWKEHCYNANHNKKKYLYDFMRYYGVDNFQIEIIDQCNDQQELDKKEIQWIKFYDSQNQEKGYNISEGGMVNFRGCHHTVESKEKISIASKNQIWTDERRMKISLAQKRLSNHVQTKEEKQKRSESLKKAYRENRHNINYTPEIREKMSIKAKLRCGYKWMEKDSVKILVKPNEIEQKYNNGWNFINN